MKTNTARSPNPSTLLHALGSVQSAQLAYGKAYYEFRDEPEATVFAKLRLIYAVLERTAYNLLIQVEPKRTPNPDRDAGPFSEDPRYSIFGIETKFAIEYLEKSELKLLQWFEGHADELSLDRDFLVEWKSVSAELTGTTPQSGSDTEEFSGNARNNDSYALCG